MPDPVAVEVRLWGQTLGALAQSPQAGVYEFQYDSSFRPATAEPALLQMPRKDNRVWSFPNLARETFLGLPGLLSDALPDRFGNSLIDAYMARNHILASEVTTIQRLLYMGHRAMGALEFEPAMHVGEMPSDGTLPLAMAALVEDARRAIQGQFEEVAQQIIDVGSSAGGARAKAVIGWNSSTQEVVSGQFDLPEGYEHWLLKFDVGTDHSLSYSRGFGRIEYAHYLMALEAGIEMSLCRLLEEGGRAHFMTRRFDRHGNEKVHVQSLCALKHLDFNIPHVHGYEQYFRACLELGLDAQALRQAWARCVFNVAICNCDDHTKNFSFLMDSKGRWSLAPAYDVAFSHNPSPGKWTRVHQMTVEGKAWDITDADLLRVATAFGVPRAKETMERIKDVVARWPEFARAAGVADEEIRRIQSFQPNWTKTAVATHLPKTR